MQREQAILRSLPLVASVLGRKYGVTVTIGGSRAYTDGHAIHLPSLPLDAPEEFLALARGYIDHESAHLRETDFAAVSEAKLTPLEKHVWNILEDWRVENNLAARFPGCRRNFNWLIERFFGKEEPAAVGADPAARLLNWLLLTVRAWDVPQVVARRDALAQEMDRSFPGLRAELTPILQTARSSCVSTKDAIALARRIVRTLENAIMRAQTDLSQEGVPPGRSRDARPQRSENSQHEQDKEDEKEPEIEAGGYLPSPGEPSCDGERQCKEGYDIAGRDAVICAEDPNTAAGGQFENKPENWKCLDSLLQAGESDLPQELGSLLVEALGSGTSADQVVTVAAADSKPVLALTPDEMEDARRASTALRVRLSGLLQAATTRRCQVGRRGRLDSNRLARLTSGEPRIFRQRGTRLAVNTAVHLLLDCSGSMLGRIRLVSIACYAIASALESIGVNVAVTAFPASPTGEHRATVGPIVRHGQRVHPRLGLTASGSTPLGEALWWVMQDMLPLREPRKLVLLLTDGDPDSTLCALHAFRQAQLLGFEVYGIGIGAVNILAHLSGRNRLIARISDLPLALFGLLEQGLLRGTRMSEEKALA